MSERNRVQWSQKHREHVFWFEKGLAVLLIVAGVVLAREMAGTMQYVGSALLGVGVWVSFPSVRPLLSALVERIPGLAPKSEDGSGEGS